jgi:seryl-tRNA synthetase
MTTHVQRQAEALQRALMNSNRAREEALAEVLNAVVHYEARLEEAANELSERANDALTRLMQFGNGGPPPVPQGDPVAAFAEQVHQGQQERWTQ